MTQTATSIVTIRDVAYVAIRALSDVTNRRTFPPLSTSHVYKQKTVSIAVDEKVAWLLMTKQPHWLPPSPSDFEAAARFLATVTEAVAILAALLNLDDTSSFVPLQQHDEDCKTIWFEARDPLYNLALRVTLDRDYLFITAAVEP